ncbi:MAG: DUF47 domain-containing protein [Clostridiaceae bacterium]
MFSLSPREDKFFDMFVTYAETIHKSSVLLKEFLVDVSNPQEKYKAIKDLEHEADNHLHNLFEELNKSFITPIDREDIHMIGRTLDDIIDKIDVTSSRIVMFNITEVRPQAVAFADVIIQATKEVIKLMNELKVMKKSKTLPQIIKDINLLEDNGDLIFREAVSELFNGQTDTLEVIKWKEIFEKLEGSLNSCENLANIVDGVVMKNA